MDSRTRPRIEFCGFGDPDESGRRICAFVRTEANTGIHTVAIAEFDEPDDARTLAIGLSLHCRILFADPETLVNLRGLPWLMNPRFEIEAGDNEWVVVCRAEERQVRVAACGLERNARLLAETFSKAARVRL